MGFKSRERDAENGKVSAVESVVRETGGADGNGAQLPIGEWIKAASTIAARTASWQETLAEDGTCERDAENGEDSGERSAGGPTGGVGDVVLELSIGAGAGAGAKVAATAKHGTVAGQKTLAQDGTGERDEENRDVSFPGSTDGVTGREGDVSAQLQIAEATVNEATQTAAWQETLTEDGTGERDAEIGALVCQDLQMEQEEEKVMLVYNHQWEQEQNIQDQHKWEQ